MLPGELYNLTKRLKSICDIGLLYSNNQYDKERYAEMLAISFELLQLQTGEKISVLKNIYPENKDYPTAKVDIRGLIIREGQILLVQESTDNKWSLPGGWADIGYSPKEVIIKECKEETGLQVIPERLLAVFDKKLHPHPPQPFYVYKLVFLCRAVTSEISKGFDIQDVRFFDVNNLPELSEDRILKSQLELIFQIASTPATATYFD